MKNTKMNGPLSKQIFFLGLFFQMLFAADTIEQTIQSAEIVINAFSGVESREGIEHRHLTPHLHEIALYGHSLPDDIKDQLKAIGFNSWYERVPKYLIELMEKNGIKVDIHDRRPFSYLELHKNLKEFKTDGLKAIGFNTWYERVPTELVTKLENNGIKVDIFERRPFSYNELHTILKEYDIYIDRIFTKGVNSYSKTCLEAMACGLVTIDYRHKDNVNERVIELLDESERKKESKENRQFIIDNHDRKKVIKKLLNIYRKQVE